MGLGRKNKQKKAEKPRVSWLLRGSNTLLALVTWTVMFLVSIYLLLFFVLNTSLGPKVLHSQLSNFLRGDYYADTMRTDPILHTLTMTNVRLSEAGKSEPVIWVPKVEAKIPTLELYELVTHTTLKVGRIKAYDADVNLDFTHGELNILKVVMPYASPPEPPSEPGSFVTWLADLNTDKAKVHLIFDGFRIDLNDVDVDHYAIKVGGGSFIMETMPWDGKGPQPIRVGHGTVAFSPATFSFPLSDIGDADEGLIMSGGSGSAGKMGYAYSQMARHLSLMLTDEPAWKKPVPPIPDMRGDFVVPIRNTFVEGFFWNENRFDIPGVTSEVGDDGTMRMENAYMNVAPTQEEMDEAEQLYQYTLSGKLPQETILWAASLSLSMSVQDHILAYFFGPILKGKEGAKLNLNAALGGDLSRVSGDISLDTDPFETFGVAVNSANLRAHMDGQKLGIQAFEADTNLGGVLLSGQYMIMDGDFDIDVWAGKPPSAEALETIRTLNSKYTDFMRDKPIMAALTTPIAIEQAFVSKLGDGLTPLNLFDNETMNAFRGVLASHLKASSENGEMRLSLPEDLTWTFDTPVMGLKQVKVSTENKDDQTLVTFKDNILKAPGGIRILADSERIVVKPGLSVNFNDLSKLTADVNVHLEDPAKYVRLLGIEDVESAPLDVSAAISTESDKPSGRFILSARDLRYEKWIVRRVGVDLSLVDGVLKTNQLEVSTDFARLVGKINGTLTTAQLSQPTKIPFRANLALTDVDFEKIPLDLLDEFGIAGMAKADIDVNGPIDDLKANLVYTMRDVEAMGEQFAQLKFRATYEDQTVGVPVLGIWFDPIEEDEQRLPDFGINTLTYHLGQNLLAFNTFLQPTSPTRFEYVKALDLPLEAELAFDLSANVDLNIIGDDLVKNLQSTWIEGEIQLTGVKYGTMAFGDTVIELSRSKQYTLLRGLLVRALPLSGFVRTTPTLASSVSISLDNLDILNLLDDVNLDISEIKQRFSLNQVKVDGSLGFCMRSLEDISASLILEDFSADVLGDRLSLGQSAILSFNLLKQTLQVRQLDLRFRDSTLKLSGNVDLEGNVEADVNGEIDAAIAKSLSGVIKNAAGLFGVSLSVRGNYLDQGAFSLKNLTITGYFGVRDPIQVVTDYAENPIELRQGFLVLDNKNTRCAKGRMCLYTPEDQSFMLGMENHWLTLDMLLDESGDFDVNLDGVVDVAIARLVSKSITAAKGMLSIKANAIGDIIDKHHQFAFEPTKIGVGGAIEVLEPISVSLASMSEPIEVHDGIVKLAEAEECPSNMPCVTIPKDRAFTGNVMGGTFIIFGEVTREALSPKSASLNITANNINFRMKDELSLVLSPDIQITAEDLYDFETMRVSGNVDVAEARYRRNFDDGTSNILRDAILSYIIDSRRRVDTYSPSFLRKFPQLAKINLDVSLSAENSIEVDVRIAGAVVDLELGTQLKIGGTIREFLPTGILSIAEGSLGFRENEFEFQSGAQIAFNNSLDGKIDMTATAEINTQSTAFSSVLGSTDLDRRKRISTSDSGSSTLYAITLNVGGSIFSPKWSFDSSPYLTDTNIYALILTGRTIEDFSGDDIAMESLLSPFFSSQLDLFIDADQFKFLFSEGAAQFVYIKQINKALRVAAGVSIKGSEGNEQALSGEYFFNDNWFFDLTGQNTADEVGRAPTFKLGARLHWHLPLD